MSSPIAKPKVLITRRWPEAAERAMQRYFDVTLNETDTPFTEAELVSAMQHYDALCPCVTDKINSTVLNAASPQVKVIGNYGVGFDHIDVQAAKTAGLVVTNTPEVLTEGTADLAMTLMMMLARRAGEGERLVRAGQWQGWYPTHMMGAEVTGKTLAIIGMGRIGLAMARKAHHGFGMKILYHNRREVADTKSLDAEYFSDLEDMLGLADFVALHCPSSPDTKHLINSARLGMMKSSARLINTSRGDVIDQDALIQALQTGQIAGAGLDVYEGEPRVPEALLGMENVVLLPHLGSATVETRSAMGLRVVNNLRSFFAGQEPEDRVA